MRFFRVSRAVFSYSNGPAMSPMTILRQSPTDPRWFEENVNDFSLSSFLGHLDAAVASEAHAANATGTTTETPTTTNAAPHSTTTSGMDGIETPHKLPLSGGGSKIPPMESSRMSTLSESSIDYMSKFEEIAQSMLRKHREQEELEQLEQQKHCDDDD